MKKICLACCCLTMLVPALAEAQTVLPASGTQVYLNRGPAQIAGVESKYKGPLAAVGQSLAKQGIHLNITYSDTFADSGNQGLTHYTTANLGKLRLEGTFNLGKIAGIKGGSLIVAETIHMFKRNPYQYLSLVGDSPGGAVIGNHKPSNDLSVLAYQQDFDNNRIEIELGRFNPSYDFDPNVCGDGPTCTLNIFKFTGYFLPVDYGQLGAVARFKLPDHFFTKFGVFEAENPPGDKTGLNFLLADSTGVLSLGQIGRATTFKTADYPGNYTFTVFQNSSKFTDTINKESHYGAWGFQFAGVQTVWRSDFSARPALPMHHLDLFMKAAATPDSYQPFSTELNTGANFYGLFPGRPNDRVGLELSYYRVGAIELAQEEAKRVKLGGAAGQTPPNEFRFQLLATFNLYRHLTVTPDLIYILNPDDKSGNSPNLPTRGFEYTLTLHVPIGSLLGLAPET